MMAVIPKDTREVVLQEMDTHRQFYHRFLEISRFLSPSFLNGRVLSSFFKAGKNFATIFFKSWRVLPSFFQRRESENQNGFMVRILVICNHQTDNLLRQMTISNTVISVVIYIFYMFILLFS